MKKVVTKRSKPAAKKPRVLSGAAWKKKHDELKSAHDELIEQSFRMGVSSLEVIADNIELREKVAAYEKHIAERALREIVESNQNDD